MTCRAFVAAASLVWMLTGAVGLAAAGLPSVPTGPAGAGLADGPAGPAGAGPADVPAGPAGIGLADVPAGPPGVGLADGPASLAGVGLLDTPARPAGPVETVAEADPAATVVPCLGPVPVPDVGRESPSHRDRSASGPEYYQFPLVSTGRVPGTGRAAGVAEVVFPSSPYGVALAEDGSYRYDFTLRLERLAPARAGAYVVWTTTPELDQVALAGPLSEPGSFHGQVAWNKFLVVVTLEPAFDPAATTWSGPVVMRGMSRSGMMHTMAGHGAFEEEKCAAYGYE